MRSYKRLAASALLLLAVLPFVRYLLNTHEEYKASADRAATSHAIARARDLELNDYLSWTTGAVGEGPPELLGFLDDPRGAFLAFLGKLNTSVLHPGTRTHNPYLFESGTHPEATDGKSRFSFDGTQPVHRWAAIWTFGGTGATDVEELEIARARFASFADCLGRELEALEKRDPTVATESIDHVLAKMFGLWDAFDGRYVVSSVYLTRSDGLRVRYPAVGSELSSEYDPSESRWWRECKSQIGIRPILSSVYDNRLQGPENLVRTFACPVQVPDDPLPWVLGIDLHWSQEELPTLLIADARAQPAPGPQAAAQQRRIWPILSWQRLLESIDPRSDYAYTGYGIGVALALAAMHFFFQMRRTLKVGRGVWHLELEEGALAEFSPQDDRTYTRKRTRKQEARSSSTTGAKVGGLVEGAARTTKEHTESAQSEGGGTLTLSVDLSKGLTVRGRDVYSLYREKPRAFTAFGVRWTFLRRRVLKWELVVSHGSSGPDFVFREPGTHIRSQWQGASRLEPYLRRTIHTDRRGGTVDEREVLSPPSMLDSLRPVQDFITRARDLEEGLFQFEGPVQVVAEVYGTRKVQAVCRDDYLYVLNDQGLGSVFTKGTEIERIILYSRNGETFRRLMEVQGDKLDHLQRRCAERYGRLVFVANEDLGEPLASYNYKDFAIVRDGTNEAVIVTEAFSLRSPLESPIAPPSTVAEPEILVTGYVSTRVADVHFYKQVYDAMREAQAEPEAFTPSATGESSQESHSTDEVTDEGKDEGKDEGLRDVDLQPTEPPPPPKRKKPRRRPKAEDEADLGNDPGDEKRP